LERDVVVEEPTALEQPHAAAMHGVNCEAIMISHRRWVPAVLFLGAVLASPSFAQSQSEEAREKPVQMSKVPQAALDAAEKALGSKPTEAKIITGTKPQQYELAAQNSSRKEFAVHVLADGTVVKSETEEEHGKE
jgi:hypothetical protein